MEGFGITDKGKVRQENQDRFIIRILDEDSAVVVLCDGMGGAQAGSVASTMAADAFATHVTECLSLPDDTRDISEIAVDAVNYANIKVYDRSFADFGCIGMGTTLVAAVIKKDRSVIVNVGDSRCYLVSNGNIKLITRDHSLVEELVGRGTLTRDEARSHPRKNVITRAMGVEQSVICDVFAPELSKGDHLLFCSDGLSNLVMDEEILSVFKDSDRLDDICNSLLDMAMKRGAEDNVTVSVLRR
jgi:serine/threonine protein phosphatase PrpC